LVDRVALLNDAIKQSDIIILAVPVDALVKLLPEVLNHVSENQVVIEVGSTKKPAVDSVRNPNEEISLLLTPWQVLSFRDQKRLFEICSIIKLVFFAMYKIRSQSS
jgi:hypothetical protein